MAESNGTLRLKIEGPEGTRQEEVRSSSFIVGTAEEAALRVADPEVADLHVRVKVKDGQVLVTDLGTESGSSIDGAEVGKDTPLKVGQTLKVGGTSVTLEALALEGGRQEESSAQEAPSTEPVKASGGRSSGGSGGGKGGRKKGAGHKVESAGTAVAASIDGNTARVLQPEAPAETEFVTPRGGRARSELDVDVPFYKSGKDPRLENYAARFFSSRLPEALRPTKESRRLQAALVWGTDQFVDVRDVTAGGLTVGPGAKAGFPVFHDAAKKDFPLVQQQGGEFRVLLPAGTDSKVWVDGKEQTAEQLVKGGQAQSLDVPVKGAAYTLGLNDRAEIQFGNVRVIARYTRPQSFKKTKIGDRIDVNFMSTVVILLLAALTFRQMILITEFGAVDLADDLFKNKDRFAKYIAKTEPPEKQSFADLSGVEEGAKAKDDEGKFGKEEAPQKEAAPSKEGSPVVDVDKREQDREKVMQSGLIALLGGEGMAGAASDVFGPGGIGTGLNESLGGIKGDAAMGDAQGVGGLGARGGGAGGGGTALGIGGLGGNGSGRGRGGSGQFDLGGTGKAATKFIPGKTTVEGGLTADEVGRVVRRHWNEIKYCYEKELTKDPNLWGKVAVYFEIGPVGSVNLAQVRETTMNSPEVEGCMLEKVRRWKFPAPRGGGVVQVTYPFILKTN